MSPFPCPASPLSQDPRQAQPCQHVQVGPGSTPRPPGNGVLCVTIKLGIYDFTKLCLSYFILYFTSDTDITKRTHIFNVLVYKCVYVCVHVYVCVSAIKAKLLFGCITLRSI